MGLILQTFFLNGWEPSAEILINLPKVRELEGSRAKILIKMYIHLSSCNFPLLSVTFSHGNNASNYTVQNNNLELFSRP